MTEAIPENQSEPQAITDFNPVTRPPGMGRYSGMNQLLHWLIALMMFAILILGWLMDPKTATPASEPIWEWHKSLGMAVLGLTAFRIAWRFLDPPPPPPAHMASWDHWLSQAVYIVFLLIMIWMPVTGYIYSTGAGHPPKMFYLFEFPALVEKSDTVKAWGKWLHLQSQWLIYGLILLHLAGVVYHVAFVRDRVLDRMLPEPVDH